MTMPRGTPAWVPLLGRRAFQLVTLALLVGVLSFVMVRNLPGDMAIRIAAHRYGYDLTSAAAGDALRDELGLDRPLWIALGGWLGHVARLDLGQSLVSGVPVWREVAYHLGATIELAAVALAIGAGLGLPFGVRAALRPHGWTDRATLVWAVVARGTPPFLVAVLLILLLAVQLGILPVGGDEDSGTVLLPALTLAVALSAGLARVTRNAVADALSEPSFEFARTKGLTDVQALVRHGLRNSAVPIVAYLGFQAVFLVEGAIVVETVFAWPGIGHALVHGIFGRDVPMIQGTALCMGLLFVLFNLLVDLICLSLDPRRHRSART